MVKLKYSIKLVFFITIIYSCSESYESKEKEKTQTRKDSVAKKEQTENENSNLNEDDREDKTKEYTDYDSIRTIKLLKKSFTIANANWNKTNFSTHFEELDSIYGNITISLSINNLFSNSENFLFIKNDYQSYIVLQIYKNKKNNFELMVEDTVSNIEFEGDTIQDINGDGYNDYVIRRYGSCGCCLKAFVRVFLFNNESNTFSKEYEFTNPTFFKDEQIIRGVNYGYAGRTSMYKLKWIGKKTKLIESIYYQENKKEIKTGKVIRSFENKKRDEILDSVPEEYKTIYGYDWFTGECCN